METSTSGTYGVAGAMLVAALAVAFIPAQKPLPPPQAPLDLRIALVALTVGTVLSGTLPQALVALARRATIILTR